MEKHSLFNKPWFRWLLAIAKGGLFFGVLAILYHLYAHEVKLQDLILPRYQVFIAFLLFQFRTFLLGLRFFVSATLQGIAVNLLDVIGLIYRSWFIAFAVPIPDSEDVYKFVYLKQKGVSNVKSTQVIFYDRIGAVIAMALIVLLALSVIALNDGIAIISSRIWTGISVVALVLGLSLFHKAVLKVVDTFAAKLNFNIVARFRSSLNEFMRAKVPYNVISTSSVLSLIYHLCAFSIIIILTGFSFDVNKWALLLLGIPFFYLSAVMPLSYQGFGLYETSLFLYLKYLGVDTAVALQASMVHLLFDIILIVLGGVFFVSYKKNHPNNITPGSIV